MDAQAGLSFCCLQTTKRDFLASMPIYSNSPVALAAVGSVVIYSFFLLVPLLFHIRFNIRIQFFMVERDISKVSGNFNT